MAAVYRRHPCLNRIADAENYATVVLRTTNSVAGGHKQSAQAGTDVAMRLPKSCSCVPTRWTFPWRLIFISMVLLRRRLEAAHLRPLQRPHASMSTSVGEQGSCSIRQLRGRGISGLLGHELPAVFLAPCSVEDRRRICSSRRCTDHDRRRMIRSEKGALR